MKPATGIAGFIARLFSNGYRDTFMVRLGTSLILSNFGIVGPVANLLGYVLRSVIGLLVETGVYQIELALDSLKEGMKREDFERDATAAYNKATAKIYDEEKKNEIRKEYLRIIASFGNVGDAPKS